tara:strand:- start:62 stop:943 length:882 start_codon:yes stop_codon:yes gene_type:complete
LLRKYDHLKYVIYLALFSLSSLLSQNSKSYFDCPCPQIIAHQGSSLELPPNTIEAFELAINQGADIIELDIWQTKDEIWIVIHDENLLRITGIDKSIGDVSLSEVRTFDAGFGFYKNNPNIKKAKNTQYNIPSLEQILKNYPNQRINIEIKDPDESGLIKLIELIKRYNMQDNILVVSSHYNVIKKFRKLTKYKIATAASRSDIKRMMFWSWIPFYQNKFDAFQLPFYSKTIKKYGMNLPDWIKEKQEMDLEVHYWTIDNSKDIMHAVSIGANGIITNRPGVVYDILKDLGRR